MKQHPFSGDLFAFRRPTCVGAAIRAATCGGVNHVGICALHPETGELLIYEAAMSYPAKVACYVNREHVKGVQAHRVKWRLEYERRCHGSVWHYPLKKALKLEEAQRLRQWCAARLGVSYDYWGAFRARALCCGWLSHKLQDRLADFLPPREHLGNLFCSEFAAAGLRQVGRFNTTNASKWSPASLCFEGQRVQGVFRKPILKADRGKRVP